MKQIQYSGVEFQVQDGPDGTKVLAIAEPPIGVHIFILEQQLADSLAAALKGEQQVIVPPKPKLVVPGA